MMMMRKSERAAAKTSGGFAKWTLTLGVAAVVGTGVLTAGAMAASRGDTTPTRGDTTAQHDNAGGTPHVRSGERSQSDMLQLQDLPDRPELGDWAAEEPSGKGLACAPTDRIEGLDAQGSQERLFAARSATGADTGPHTARIGEMVLVFSDQAGAVDAMQSVASWFLDCAPPDLVKHDFLASETVEDPGAAGFWETLLRSAQDFCGGTDCDAVWFDREALVHVGSRLVLVSLAEVGGPLEPDGLTESMRALVSAAINAAT